jgi:hypothetical protein
MYCSEFEISVFLKEIDEEIWPVVVNGLNNFDMSCRIIKQSSCVHPNFISFGFSLQENSYFSLSDEMCSGFFFNIKRFDSKTEPIRCQLSDESLDKYLKTANYKLEFKWTPTNVFSIRFAFLSSAILAERFKGIIHYPPQNLWHGYTGSIKNAWKEVQNFERFVLPRLFPNLSPSPDLIENHWKKADIKITTCLN